ncbi:MAG: 23S rRNA (adenine(2030)-N(6))-methyltransferase RlmJ [Pseudolabrys sp.]|nr:23S rRNA (adenine(2030)-N(6))-methyltransferase RlmJ [Pseudolabrys sp.]
MNYAHEFHAGSFADVHKHAVLCRVLAHLGAKEAPFRVLDTHAGAGLYDLHGAGATRSGEWRDGIARLVATQVPRRAADLLAPYLAAVRACNRAGGLDFYPGSPALARRLLRPQDRLIACELEPRAAAALRRNLRGDRRLKALHIDGWTALNAFLPPPERRGLVLIDPPYEQDGDFARLPRALADAHRKWATGVYMAWYPIKNRHQSESLARRLRRLAIPKILRAELEVAASGERLRGSGLVLINPPWRLADELAALQPALAAVFGRGGEGGCRLDWLAGEYVAAAG